MKTSGFREIDFTKIECKNCGKYQYSANFYVPPVPAGMVFEQYVEVIGTLFLEQSYRSRLVDCPVCKGTGYINENSETELELE